MTLVIDIFILTMLVITAITIIRMRSLFAAVMLSGIYSLLSACWMVVLDAVDVAFTEAAVGAGISTVLMLATLALTTRQEKKPVHKPALPLIIVIATGLILFYGVWGAPDFGDPNAPVHLHVAPRYIEEAGDDTGVPNVVTAVLASYRGYDTLGETTVIFTAGVGVMLLLMRRRRRAKKEGAQ